MPETLVIRLPDEADIDAEWTVIDDAGTRIGQVRRGSLNSAAQDQLQRQVVVLVPGTQTVSARANLPVKSVSKMLQVVPFALEPQIAGDVADMHFAVGRRNDDGDVDVVAVERARMTDWMASLEAAGIQARRIVPDTAGVPVTEDGITVVMRGDEAYIRDRNGDVVAVDHDSIVASIELLSQDTEDETPDNEVVAVEDDDAIDPDEDFTTGPDIVIYLDEDGPAEDDRRLTAIAAAFTHAEFRRLSSGLLPRLGVEACESTAPNLLQGDFARSGSLRKMWEPWRTAAMLLAGAVLLALTAKGAELFINKNRYAELEGQIQQLFAETYPSESVPSNPRLFFERRMGQSDASGAEGSTFLEALRAVAEAKPANTDLRAVTMNFNAEVLNMEILAADVPTLDALRVRITESNQWEARLTQTSPEDGKTKGRLQLQRSSP